MTTIISVTEPGFAALQGNDDVLRDLFKRHGDTIHSPDSEGATPLHLASERGHYETAYLLVKKLGADRFAVDKTGASALHYAVQNNQHATAEFLVTELGLDVNGSDLRGRTALLLAAANGFNLLLNLLARELGADPTASDDSGRGALFCAAWNGHDASVLCLCHFAAAAAAAAGAGAGAGAARSTEVNTVDSEGATAFHAAAHSGFASTLRLLASDPNVGSHVNGVDNFGYAPLHCAAAAGHTGAVVCLVSELGACVDCCDLDGWTALMHCLEQGHVRTAKALLDLGARTAAVGGHGLSALSVAQARRRTERQLLLAAPSATARPATTTTAVFTTVSTAAAAAADAAASPRGGCSRVGFSDVADLMEHFLSLQFYAREGRVAELVSAIEQGFALAPKQWLPLLPVRKMHYVGGALAVKFPRNELLRWTSGVVGDSRACFLALYGPTIACSTGGPTPRRLEPLLGFGANSQVGVGAYVGGGGCSSSGGGSDNDFHGNDNEGVGGGRRILLPPPPRHIRHPTRRKRGVGLSLAQRERRAKSPRVSRHGQGAGSSAEGFRSSGSSSSSLLRLVVHDGQPIVRQRIVSYLVHLPSPDVRALVRSVHAQLSAEALPANREQRRIEVYGYAAIRFLGGLGRWLDDWLQGRPPEYPSRQVSHPDPRRWP